jgi:hypothetical protein
VLLFALAVALRWLGLLLRLADVWLRLLCSAAAAAAAAFATAACRCGSCWGLDLVDPKILRVWC